MPDSILRKGEAAFIAGKKTGDEEQLQEAQSLFELAAKLAPDNPEPWLCLCVAVGTDQEKLYCARHVLELRSDLQRAIDYADEATASLWKPRKQAPGIVSLSATPTTILPAGAGFLLTALFCDQNGDRVSDGTQVTFDTSPGRFSQATVPTTDGIAQTTLIVDASAGTTTVSARIDGASGTTKIHPSRGPTHSVQVDASPDEIRVNGATSTITATVNNKHGRPVADGMLVLFYAGRGPLLLECARTKNGKASAKLKSDTKAGAVTVTAYAEGMSDSTQVTFRPGPPHGMEVTALPEELRVGGYTSTITAIVKDKHRNPVSDGIEVTFALTEGCLYPPVVPTTGGQAQTTVTSNLQLGTAIVSAKAGRAHKSVNLTFIPDLPPAVKRCLACKRLILDDTDHCPVCDVSNKRWWQLTWRDHLSRFPMLFWLALAVLLLATPFFWVLAGWVDLDPAIVRISALSSASSFILSLIIAASVFALRLNLREYDFLRQVRKHRPSLITLALIFGGVGLLISLGLGFLLWEEFHARPEPRWAIETINLPAMTHDVILEQNARIMQPAWSPDHEALVFASDRDGNWDIFSADERGTDLTNLTKNDAIDVAPVWSSDGSRIAFISNRTGLWRFWSMDANGRNPRMLTDDADQEFGTAEPFGQTQIAFSIADPRFLDSLDSRNRLWRRIALNGNIFYLLAGPFLVLGLMLVGVRAFSKRLDEEFARPVFFDIDDLARVARRSVHQHLHVRTEEGESFLDPTRLPIDVDAHRLVQITEEVADSLEDLFNIPENKKQELVLSSVVGRQEGGIGFLFERRDERRSYWVETDLEGKLSGFAESPRVETLRIVSMDRTDSGGLKMVIGRRIESEKKQESGEFRLVSEETCYDVETDEWGYIHSLKEQDAKKEKGLWANPS